MKGKDISQSHLDHLDITTFGEIPIPMTDPWDWNIFTYIWLIFMDFF